MEGILNAVIIPLAQQIVVDDVGWFYGTDQRYTQGPSRTAMPRRHRAEDYLALDMLGRGLGMKISCAFIAGEWDDDNSLRSVRGASQYGSAWNNSAYFNPVEAQKCRAAIKDSEYIELALHGLLHFYWDNGRCVGSEFYLRGENGNKDYKMIDREIISEHLDAFFNIINRSGFEKKVTGFIPPCFEYVFDKSDGGLSHILKDYGILYCSLPFSHMQAVGQNPILCDCENGIITVDRSDDFCKWYHYDTRPNYGYKKDGIFGFHWGNLLKLDPKNNPLTVQRWIDYFQKQAGRFGTMLSKDMAFCASQAMYKRFAKIKSWDNKLQIDLSAPELKAARGLLPQFYISVKNGLTPETGEIYTKHAGHTNYKINVDTDVINISFY